MSDSNGKAAETGDMMAQLAAWARAEDSARGDEFQGYVYGIAQARYVIRRVFRIVDDEAKKMNLDPLAHQALLQLYGAGPDLLTVGQLAARLDIVPALASRLVKQLDDAGYVERLPQEDDKRVIKLAASPAGEKVLRAIDGAVHTHVEYFQTQLTDDQRTAALIIFTFYLGLGTRFPPDRGAMGS